MQREILHKGMGNNDINIDMELQKTSANQLNFCIWPLPRLVSFRFKLRMDKYKKKNWINIYNKKRESTFSFTFVELKIIFVCFFIQSI